MLLHVKITHSAFTLSLISWIVISLMEQLCIWDWRFLQQCCRKIQTFWDILLWFPTFSGFIVLAVLIQWHSCATQVTNLIHFILYHTKKCYVFTEESWAHMLCFGPHTVTSNYGMSLQIKHLFWKYLRSESYRKALVWQKRYLLLVLGGYQEAEAITVSRLAHLSGVQETMLYRQQSVPQKKPRTRFK